MRKLKLSELNLGSAEVLSREQLKKVLGGLSSDIGGCNGLPEGCMGTCTLFCGGQVFQGTCELSNHNTQCSCVGGC
jgi:hypothetical protein